MSVDRSSVEKEALRRVAVAASRLRQAQRRLHESTTTEEALEAAREEARALRSLDRALEKLELVESGKVRLLGT